MKRIRLICGLLLAVTLSVSSLAQRSKRTLVCKPAALAALKEVPQLSYPCDEQLSDYDEKILKLPARSAAIKTLMTELGSLFDAAWWMAATRDLTVCDFAGKAGALTPDQRETFLDGDYAFWLFGNNHIRLVLSPDPCYQTEYGGLNAFLLYRSGGRVYVTQVLDGYFTRADNSVNMAFAKLDTEEIIEISTGTGGLTPSLTNYYFVIDPHTNRAVPKNLFHGRHGLTNQISSALLLGNAPAAEPLQVIVGNAVAQSFIVYVDNPNGKIDDNGRRASRKLLRWNGKIFQ